MRDKRIGIAFILGLLSCMSYAGDALTKMPALAKDHKASSSAQINNAPTHKSNLPFQKLLPFFTEGHFYISGTAGASIGHVGESIPTITYYNNLLTDTYPITQSTSTTGMLGIGGGIESIGQEGFPMVALGASVYTTPSGNPYRGHVLETAQGGTTNLLYTN